MILNLKNMLISWLMQMYAIYSSKMAEKNWLNLDYISQI